LQTHKDLTLQLVWQEGRERNPDGYGYSRFCDLYRRWLKKLDLVLRQEHRAGEKMFVDYAGATIPIHNPESGDVHPAAVFVAVLGASSYTFAEVTTGQDLRSWIGSHNPRSTPRVSVSAPGDLIQDLATRAEPAHGITVRGQVGEQDV
jgi:transposase